MHLPPLPLSSNYYVHTEGDVSIDPSAAIGSGVILRAGTDSKIIVGAGVCIGIGSILTASQGILEVEAGANLGAGVLVVGKGKIGTNACIGALTTIWNASIEPWQVVSPGSLVGNQGRQVPTPAVVTDSVSETTELSASTSTTQESLNGQDPTPKTVVPDPAYVDSSTELKAEDTAPKAENSVYGQQNLNRLLKTLFPYNNQSFNPPTEDS